MHFSAASTEPNLGLYEHLCVAYIHRKSITYKTKPYPLHDRQVQCQICGLHARVTSEREQGAIRPFAHSSRTQAQRLAMAMSAGERLES